MVNLEALDLTTLRWDPADRILAAFRGYDVEGRHVISRAHLEALLCQAVRPPLAKSEVVELSRHLDLFTNARSEVNYEHFLQWLYSPQARHPSKRGPPSDGEQHNQQEVQQHSSPVVGLPVNFLRSRPLARSRSEACAVSGSSRCFSTGNLGARKLDTWLAVGQEAEGWVSRKAEARAQLVEGWAQEETWRRSRQQAAGRAREQEIRRRSWHGAKGGATEWAEREEARKAAECHVHEEADNQTRADSELVRCQAHDEVEAVASRQSKEGAQLKAEAVARQTAKKRAEPEADVMPGAEQPQKQTAEVSLRQEVRKVKEVARREATLLLVGRERWAEAAVIPEAELYARQEAEVREGQIARKGAERQAVAKDQVMWQAEHRDIREAGCSCASGARSPSNPVLPGERLFPACAHSILAASDVEDGASTCLALSVLQPPWAAWEEPAAHAHLSLPTYAVPAASITASLACSELPESSIRHLSHEITAVVAQGLPQRVAATAASGGELNDTANSNEGSRSGEVVSPRFAPPGLEWPAEPAVSTVLAPTEQNWEASVGCFAKSVLQEVLRPPAQEPEAASLVWAPSEPQLGQDEVVLREVTRMSARVGQAANTSQAPSELRSEEESGNMKTLQEHATVALARSLLHDQYSLVASCTMSRTTHEAAVWGALQQQAELALQRAFLNDDQGSLAASCTKTHNAHEATIIRALPQQAALVPERGLLHDQGSLAASTTDMHSSHEAAIWGALQQQAALALEMDPVHDQGSLAASCTEVHTAHEALLAGPVDHPAVPTGTASTASLQSSNPYDGQAARARLLSQASMMSLCEGLPVTEQEPQGRDAAELLPKSWIRHVLPLSMGTPCSSTVQSLELQAEEATQCLVHAPIQYVVPPFMGTPRSFVSTRTTQSLEQGGEEPVLGLTQVPVQHTVPPFVCTPGSSNSVQSVKSLDRRGREAAQCLTQAPTQCAVPLPTRIPSSTVSGLMVQSSEGWEEEGEHQFGQAPVQHIVPPLTEADTPHSAISAQTVQSLEQREDEAAQSLVQAGMASARIAAASHSPVDLELNEVRKVDMLEELSEAAVTVRSTSSDLCSGSLLGQRLTSRLASKTTSSQDGSTFAELLDVSGSLAVWASPRSPLEVEPTSPAGRSMTSKQLLQNEGSLQSALAEAKPTGLDCPPSLPPGTTSTASLFTGGTEHSHEERARCLSQESMLSMVRSLSFAEPQLQSGDIAAQPPADNGGKALSSVAAEGGAGCGEGPLDSGAAGARRSLEELSEVCEDQGTEDVWEAGIYAANLFQVAIWSATQLPSAAAAPGPSGSSGKPCWYCSCEVPGKPSTKFRTRAARSGSAPHWNHRAAVAGLKVGDPLEFAVWNDWDGRILACLRLEGFRLLPAGLEGELPLGRPDGGGAPEGEDPASWGFLRLQVIPPLWALNAALPQVALHGDAVTCARLLRLQADPAQREPRQLQLEVLKASCPAAQCKLPAALAGGDLRFSPPRAHVSMSIGVPAATLAKEEAPRWFFEAQVRILEAPEDVVGVFWAVASSRCFGMLPGRFGPSGLEDFAPGSILSSQLPVGLFLDGYGNWSIWRYEAEEATGSKSASRVATFNLSAQVSQHVLAAALDLDRGVSCFAVDGQWSDAVALPELFEKGAVDAGQPAFFPAAFASGAAEVCLLAGGSTSGSATVVGAASVLGDSCSLALAPTSGPSLLMASALRGHWCVVRALIREGLARLRGKARKRLLREREPRDGRTLLHLACAAGEADFVRDLLEFRAEPCTRDLAGCVPLELAVRSAHKEAAAMAFHGAAAEKCTPLAKVLLALLLRSEDGRLQAAELLGAEALGAAFQGAAARGSAACLRVLLESLANAELLHKDCSTALLLASKAGHAAAVLVILEARAQVGAVTRHGRTSLHAACQHGHEEVVGLLLGRRASINQTAGGVGCKNPLALACRGGHAKVVRCILNAQAAVDEDCEDGWTALHLACQYGHKVVVEVLLDARGTMEAKAKGGWTPLHVVAHNGEQGVARFLINRKASPSTTCDHDAAPLHLAAQKGHVGLARCLVEHEAAVDAGMHGESTALHIACQNGHMAMACVLLDLQANIDLEMQGGMTALHVALQTVQHRLVELLLQRRASSEKRMQGGYTALALAAKGGQKAIVRLLLVHRADTGSAAGCGRTPLLLACIAGHASVAGQLLQGRAVPNLATSNGRTPLIVACQGGHTVVAGKLLGGGAEVGIAMQDAWTALHFAAQSGHGKLCGVLLDCKASADAMTAKGWTALHLAAQAGESPGMQVLLEHRATLDAMHGGGATALHLAAQNDRAGAVRLLLAWRAAPNATAEGDTTALHMASQSGHVEVARLLLDFRGSPDWVAQGGATALILASQAGHGLLARLLLEHRAAVGVQLPGGWSALMIAGRHGHESVVKALLEWSAPVGAATRNGQTALHFASLYGHEAAVRALLAGGAGCSLAVAPATPAVGQQGAPQLKMQRKATTPLHLAKKKGHKGVITLLLAANHSDSNKPGN